MAPPPNAAVVMFGRGAPAAALRCHEDSAGILAVAGARPPAEPDH